MHFYRTLGVNLNATQDEIDIAFAAAKTSPDIEHQLEAHMAYTVLSDPQARQAHDQELAQLVKEKVFQLAFKDATGRIEARREQPFEIHQAPRFMPQPDMPATTSNPLLAFFVWFTMAGASVLLAFLYAMVGQWSNLHG